MFGDRQTKKEITVYGYKSTWWNIKHILHTKNEKKFFFIEKFHRYRCEEMPPNYQFEIHAQKSCACLTMS